MEPQVEFLTGPAGTGKTYEAKRRINSSTPEELRQRKNRKYGTLCATTGIAAVNLGPGVTTINSILKYFDTESLKDAYARGKLTRALHNVASLGANLLVDEVSMLEATQLDIIYHALLEVNNTQEVMRRGGLGLVLTGDFCQLPPVQGQFAFEAQCWPKFAEHTTRLTKIWRQEGLEFLEALNAARAGDGEKTAAILNQLQSMNGDYHQIYVDCLDLAYDGTTICALNRDVDRINTTRLLGLLAEGKKKIVFKSFRWGQQRGEWKIIPQELVITEGSYVMILANNPPKYDYANGDCGWVEEAQISSCEEKESYAETEVGGDQNISNGLCAVVGGGNGVSANESPGPFELLDLPLADTPSLSGSEVDYFSSLSTNEGDSGISLCGIRLVRNGTIVSVRKITRKVTQKEKPIGLEEPRPWLSKKEYGEEHASSGWTSKELDLQYRRYLVNLTAENRRKPMNQPYFDYEDERWVIGEITYMPLRLGYASTVHKTQGLTLDRVQLDIHNGFFGSPSMMYVALSRVRSHKGLKVVGGERLLESRTNVLEDVLRWI